MAYTECGKGHVFDNSQYQVCPYCNGGGNRIEFGAGPGAAANSVGKTVAATNGYQAPNASYQQPTANQYTGATGGYQAQSLQPGVAQQYNQQYTAQNMGYNNQLAGVNQGYANQGYTQQANQGYAQQYNQAYGQQVNQGYNQGYANQGYGQQYYQQPAAQPMYNAEPQAVPDASRVIGATVAPVGYKGDMYKPPVPENETGATTAPDLGKTVGLAAKNSNKEPVVGWLVCIDGMEKGKDYKVLAKENTIGRNEKNDINIKGDTSISRDAHAKLVYNAAVKSYTIIPAENTNGVSVNGAPIAAPTVLNGDDVIDIGATKLLFVPFVSNKFNWDNGLM